MPEPLILAIDTSGRTASVALIEVTGDDFPVRFEKTLPPEQRTAQMLVPAINGLLEASHSKVSQVAGLAVVTGPGSFTGLRIGVTVAKLLAYAAGTPLAGVNTLDVLAAQAPAAATRVWSVLDAQRGDLFAACYAADDRQAPEQTDRTQLLSGSEWLGQLAAGDLVLGPVASRYESQLPDGVEFADPQRCTPQAATVGRLGWQQIQQQGGFDPFALVPRYHRLSAAEEKARAAKP